MLSKEEELRGERWVDTQNSVLSASLPPKTPRCVCLLYKQTRWDHMIPSPFPRTTMVDTRDHGGANEKSCLFDPTSVQLWANNNKFLVHNAK